MASTRNSSSLELPPVDLNQRIGVLTRREVEGRLLAPLLAGLGREFGAERVLRVTRAPGRRSLRSPAGRGRNWPRPWVAARLQPSANPSFIGRRGRPLWQTDVDGAK